MALTEQFVVSKVTVNSIADAIEVEIANQILRDGVVISSSPHRCAYSRDMKDKLISDIGDVALPYISIIGW